MLLRTIINPLPFAVVWVILTNQVNLAGFLIGYALAFGMGRLFLLPINPQEPIRLRHIPRRIGYVISYILRLSVDIFLSGVDVSLRVMGLRPISRSGIVAVPIQDETHNEVIAGLSAHAITITPGELVVAYDTENDLMYVHCLDVVQAEPTLDSEQAARVKIYRRILGYD